METPNNNNWRRKCDRLAKSLVYQREDENFAAIEAVRASLTKSGDKISIELLREFDLAVEAHAAVLFFKEISCFVENDKRLTWLFKETQASIVKRWNYETKASRTAVQRREAPKERKAPFSKEDLERLKGEKLQVIALTLGVNVKTAKVHAAKYGIDLGRSQRKKHR